MSYSAPGLATAALLALAPMPVAAQTAVEIDDQITCPECVIEVGAPVTLDPPAGHVYFVSIPPPLVARDREGNYIVTRVQGDGLVAVFGADGTYRSSYGRIGDGPGEFAGIPMAMGVGESDILYVIDQRSLHTLAPRAGRSLDQSLLPVFASTAVVLRSGIAIQAPLRTEAGITTVQILQPDGTIRANVGVAGTPDERSRQGPLFNDTGLRRILGRSNDGADVWSAPLDRYQVIRYGPDGEEKTRIERVSEWFRPPGAPGASSSGPGNPGLVSIHQDADGLLWIAIFRPQLETSPADDERPRGVEGPPLDPFGDWNQRLDGTVEVLDPVRGELIARLDFDEVVTFVSTPGDGVFMYSLHPDALGELSCVIRPLQLRRPASSSTWRAPTRSP